MDSEPAVYYRNMLKQWVRCILCAPSIGLDNGFVSAVYSRYMVTQWVRSLLCTPGIFLNNGFGVYCVLQVYGYTMDSELAVYYRYMVKQWVRSNLCTPGLWF